MTTSLSDKSQALAHEEGFATQVPGLDVVAGGGLRAGHVLLVEGPAGAGKTLLSCQIAFSLAALGQHVVYVSLVSEGHGKLLAHLRSMDFFNEAQVNTRIAFHSGYPALRDGGYKGLLEALALLLRAHRPKLLVIEGFGCTAHFGAEPALSDFLQALSALMSATRTAALLLSASTGNTQKPERALVDGIIELNVEAFGLRKERYLEVHKLRAADHLMGRHAFSISQAGISVFPRLEALAVRCALVPEVLESRLSTGVEGLDAMAQGGCTAGSTTSLIGPPGSGKTLMGLSFLMQGLREGQHCACLGFYEAPARLWAKAARVGMDFTPYLHDGRMRIAWQPALEFTLDELAERLLAMLRERPVQRVFIDGLEGFRDAAAFPQRLPRLLVALTSLLRAQGTTLLVTEELPLFPEHGHLPVAQFSGLFENILWLRHSQSLQGLRKVISIVKMRDSDFDTSTRELLIDTQGLHVGRSLEGLTTPQRDGSA